jgi:hypothetical protein
MLYMAWDQEPNWRKNPQWRPVTASWSSYKPQASSLTAGPGDDRMDLERNNYGHNTIKKNSRRSGGDPETSKTRYGKV